MYFYAYLSSVIVIDSSHNILIIILNIRMLEIMQALFTFLLHQIVAPKRQRLEAAEADLKIHMQNLKIKREELKEVTAKLKALQDQLSQKLGEKRVLEENINMTM